MTKPTETLSKKYFDDVYAANADPWNFAASDYEAEKYAATINALPREKYTNAFEIGCSIGVLTEKLARRCEKLLSVDVAEKALEQARERNRDAPHVTFKLLNFPREFPTETFDLILVSEVGYYLSPDDWRSAIEKIFAHLAPHGQVVLVHWLPEVDDYPQTGDAVHDSFAAFAANEMEKLKSLRTEKYRLDVWQKI